MKRKTLIPFLIVFSLLLTVPSVAASETNEFEWSSSYRDYIMDQKYIQDFEDYGTISDSPDIFFLHDMDGDGFPELLIGNLMAGGGAYWLINVYGFHQGELRNLGEISGRKGFDMVSVSTNDCPGIFIRFNESGYRHGCYYDVRNGNVHQDDFCMISNSDSKKVEFSKDPVVRKYFYDYFVQDTPSYNGFSHRSFYNLSQIRSSGWESFVSYMGFFTDPVVAGFADVPEGKWFSEGIGYAVEKGYMAGTGNNRFSPQSTVTRGTIAQIFYAAEGKPSVSQSSRFSDVVSGKWYANGVNWAAEQGLVSGYGQGKFGPNDSVTREQMVAIMRKYAAMKGFDTSANADLSDYPDQSTISKYAVDGIRWAVSHHVITGTKNGIEPKGTATRAQVAVILQAFDKNIRE